MSQNYPTFDGDEKSSLLKRVQMKDDFRAKKWRCVTHPNRAMETLSPYAVLEVGIMAARDLTERESGFFNTDTTPDPFVQVLLNDSELDKCQTLPARRMKDPTWMYHCEVDLLAPMSMIRLQVKDDRPTEKADIGFVDICVGDIPYDKVIEGWAELRFQESLKSTSVHRYLQHCAMREEAKTEEEAKRKKEEMESNAVVDLELPEGDKTTLVVKRTQVYAETKERAMDAFQACVHSTADISDQMGLETLGKSLREGGRKKRSNAGEVYISLRLKLLVNKFDSLFAYALDPPPPLNYGAYEEHVMITRRIDIQRVYDDIMEVKVRVLDDAVLCCVYGFRFLVTWRSAPLSACYLVGLLLCCWKAYLTWAIIPLLLAISLIVNSFPKARSYMTRGGMNAPLTEDGFKYTAAWRDSSEVLTFVMRVLKEDMKAKVGEDPKRQLRTFASQCVRDGQPTITLEQMRLALSAAEFIEMEELRFRKGDLVWVEGRFPAKVEATDGTDRVLVSYEKSLVNDELPPEELRARQVTLRSDGLPDLSKLMRVPGLMDKAIEAIYPHVEMIRHSSLPSIHALTQMLTWKKSAITMALVAILLITSALFSYAAILHRTANQKGDMSRKEEVLIQFLRSIDNWIAAFIVVGIFFLQGWFMSNVSSVIKIATRAPRARPAPSQWEFFKQDYAQADMLRTIAAREAEMHPHGMFHLPYMTADGSTASASYQAAHAVGPMGP